MKRLHLAVYLAAALIYIGCNTGDISGTPEAPFFRSCPIDLTNWPGGVFDVHTDMPAGCPLKLQYEGQWVNFSGVATWPSSGYVVYGMTDLSYRDGNQVTRGAFYYPIWTQSTAGYTVQFTGQYQAALAGFQIQYNRDLLIFRFQRLNSTYAVAGFTAAYGFGSPLRLEAPESVDPYTGFRVNADVLDPNLVPPISYSWTDNDSPMDVTSDYFDFPGQNPGVNHTFHVTITDSENRVLTSQVYVHTRTCTAPCNES